MNTNRTRQFAISPGSGTSGLGGAILTLMFFLPWFSGCNVAVSGKDLAFGITMDAGAFGSATGRAAYPWLALVLLCGITATLVVTLGFVWPSIVKPSLRSFINLGTGALAVVLLGIVLWGYLDQATQAGDLNIVSIEYGFPGAFLGALMIAGGAIWELWPVTRQHPQIPQYESDTSPPQYQPQGSPPLAPPITPKRAWLRGQAGALNGQSIELPGDRITIGRSSESQVHISDSRASRQHAVIRYAQGRYYLQDQQSAHGTLLNRQPIEASVLNDGDLITIGDTTLEFRMQ